MSQDNLQLGIIGESEGNGHPFSWSAIFNGYEKSLMKTCGYPAIPEYLEKQSFPKDQISGASVTHIWTQDRKRALEIQKTCLIKNCVDTPEEMLGQVDAVLLARDDYVNHLKHSKPFLEAGLPIYIDKPIATRISDLKELLALARNPQQVFTCSAFRFAKEIEPFISSDNELGEIYEVEASIVKSWDKYAIHIIEPSLKILGTLGEIKTHSLEKKEDSRFLTVEWKNGKKASFLTAGSREIPTTLKITGKNGVCEIEISDVFSAFKSALSQFIAVVRKERENVSLTEVEEVVQLIEYGLK